MKEEGEIKPLDEKDCFLYFSEQIEVAIRVKSNSHSQREFQIDHMDIVMQPS